MRSFSIVATLLACLLSLPVLAKNRPPPKVAVKAVDPKFGFILITIGEKHTKKGDAYNVTRGGKFVGTIVVHAVKGGIAFCRVDKARTTGMDKNPLIGDIRCGDVVACGKLRPLPFKCGVGKLKANPKNAMPNQIRLYY